MSDTNPFHASWSNNSGEDFFGQSDGGGARPFSRAVSSSSVGTASAPSRANSGLAHGHVRGPSSFEMSIGSGASLYSGSDGDMGVDPSSLVSSLPKRPDPISRVSSVQSRSSSIGGFVNGISSVIHDAARIASWPRVKELCESIPEAAAYISSTGETALHHLCNRRCPHADVAEALINAYPDAIMQIDESKEWTPLHFACRFKAPVEVVRLLVNLYPELGHKSVSWLDKKGRSPLHYAIRYDAPPGVVGILLEVDPSVVLNEDESADSPLSLVWTRWAEKSDGKTILQYIVHPKNESEELNPQVKAEGVMKRLKTQSQVYNRWRRADMLLKAAFGFQVDDDNDENSGAGDTQQTGLASNSSNSRTWRILHATAAIRCHISLFNLACALYPSQANEQDSRDLKWPESLMEKIGGATKLTALHLAAASPVHGETKKSIIHQLLKLNPTAAFAKTSDGRLPLHFMAQNPHCMQWVIDGVIDLYSANKNAVTDCDFDGQLPLHRSASTVRDDLDNDSASPSNEERSPFSTMRILLNLHGDGASHQDNSGCYPIHHASKSGKAWDDDLEALYNAYPNAVKTQSGVVLHKRLPLHLAVSNPFAEASLIKKVLQIHISAASRTDRQGKLPLHIACEAGISWDKGGRLLYEANPEALSQPEDNPRGWTALHMACNSPHTGPDLIGKLIEHHPESAGVADNDIRYPFHLACASRKGWASGLEALFLSHPDALRCPDRFGLLPFHIASMNFSVDKPFHLPSHPKNRKQYRSAAIEAELKKIQEAEELKAIGLLFQLLKADPSIL